VTVVTILKDDYLFGVICVVGYGKMTVRRSKIIIIYVGTLSTTVKNYQEVDDFDWYPTSFYKSLYISITAAEQLMCINIILSRTRIYRYEKKKIVGSNSSDLCITYII